MTQLTVLWVGEPDGLELATTKVAARTQFRSIFARTAEDVCSKLGRFEVHCICILAEDPQSADSLLSGIRHFQSSAPVIFYSPGMPASKSVALMKAGVSLCLAERVTTDRLSELIADIGVKPLKPLPVLITSPSELLLGESAAMTKVRDLIRMVAKRTSTVLITGETGTGKELAARSIHRHSDRSHHDLVSVNCAALPDSLLEAELFGHVKGAYTGAAANRVGRFEQAQQSTLFLDEISEMPLETQSKLLRVLQERELQRLGSSETVKVDVRVVAASNIDITRAIKQQRFRADLLYRLRVVELRMPSLRERIEDIPILADHFVEKVCRRERMPLKHLEPSVLRFLSNHTWPGNIRELEHAIESAVILSGDRKHVSVMDFNLCVDSTDPSIAPVDLPASGMDLDHFVQSIEATLLGQALRRSMGNKAKAAEMLGIPRTTLISKVKSMQLAS